MIVRLFDTTKSLQTKQFNKDQAYIIYDNNWVWKITGVKRVNTGRVDDPREKIGMQTSLRNRVKWTRLLLRIERNTVLLQSGRKTMLC